MNSSTARPDFRVTDLKQYAYCPRIPFYNHVMGLYGKPTYKMAQGKAAQDAMEALERRRKLRQYGLADGERHFGVKIVDDTLSLGGTLDLAIETDDACYPVDFKYTTGRPHRNHTFQLAGYALLLQGRFGKPVPFGFIFLTIDDAVVRIPLDDDVLVQARSALASMRSMIEAEILPEPTDVRARCTDCEYRNFCGDVF